MENYQFVRSISGGKLQVVQRDDKLWVTKQPNPHEVKVLREIGHHDHILPLTDIVDGCMVMPHLPNGDLLDVITSGLKVSESQTRVWMRQLLSALQHIHDKRVCHLDVSLENIMLDANYNAVLMDFGESRLFDDLNKAWIENPGHRAGKPAYMAPEVMDADQPYGFESDIYSLGVSLLTLMLRNRPYLEPGDRWHQVLQSGGVKALFDLYKLPSISSDLENLLTRMLHSNASERITLDDMVQHPWFGH